MIVPGNILRTTADGWSLSKLNKSSLSLVGRRIENDLLVIAVINEDPRSIATALLLSRSYGLIWVHCDPRNTTVIG